MAEAVKTFHMELKRKRIGLVTFYSDNYGSCLQAFALFNTIKQLGYEPTLIKYSRSSDNGGDKSLLGKLKHHSLSSIIKGLHDYRMIRGKKEAFVKFRNSQFPFTDKEYNKDSDETYLNSQYDRFVCGSDMMWCEVFKNDWYHHFLGFATKDKRISYAPSFGINEISDTNYELCKKYLKGFNPSCLSCRDISGVQMIRDKFGLESHHVVDPTMLLTKQQWNNIINDNRMIKKPYVLLYLFGGIEGERKSLLNQIKKWGIGDLKSISISGKYRINNPQIGPFEYVQLFRDAQFVVTDTFHGLMFSLIFEKPFVVLTRNDGKHWAKYSDRMTAQLDMLDISERYHDPAIPIPDSFKTLDYSLISEKIDVLREQSLHYLNSALSAI